MDDSVVRMNRVSTMAYKELRAPIHSSRPAPSAHGDNPQAGFAPIFEELNAVTRKFGVSGVKNFDQAYEKLSQLMERVKSGTDVTAVAAALKAFRGVCGEAIISSFNTGMKDAAQSASDILDAVNRALKPLSTIALQDKSIPLTLHDGAHSLANGSTTPAYPVLQKPVLPNESDFFLPSTDLSDILTISADRDLLERTAASAWGAAVGPAGVATGAPRGRGRPRGRPRGGRSGSFSSILGMKRPNIPSVWTSEVQRYLSIAMRVALRHEGASGPTKKEVTGLPAAFKEFSKELQDSGACEGMRTMGAMFPGVSATLQASGYSMPEEFLGALSEEAHAAAEAYLTQQNPYIRRGKIIGAADSFINLVSSMLDYLMAECGIAAKAARFAKAQQEGLTEMELAVKAAAEEEARRRRLPACILNNREPYRHGDWRKTPFAPRPYVRLQEYYIVEEESRDAIQRKLRTTKAGGCDGLHCVSRDGLGTYSLEADGFKTKCGCLSRNTECDDTCGCNNSSGADQNHQGGPRCLNRAVTRRETLVLGRDVEEINSWGIDCYTRRNIQDAVLESQAFGEYTMPKFGADVSAPPRPAATAAGQHAALAAESPPADALLVADPEVSLQKKVSGGDSGATTSAPAVSCQAQQNGGNVVMTPGSTAQASPQEARDACKAAVERAAIEWIERTLVPEINRQGDKGWDIHAALRLVRKQAEASGDAASVKAAAAVAARVDEVGYNYFRIHPKGVGMVCKRPGGLPRLTFVEEYLGEIHCPWRWFELQDAVKRITGDELPDFYNIVLERPRDDPAGYDVLFVDAAAKGALASRMSHSCTPNCQAVVMACGGRLTIALYTLRHVLEGEELTFDYSSVTESEKEFRDAICLCSTHMCRGSYLYFTGSRAFMQVVSAKHNMLHRQAIIARAGSEPLTDADRQTLKRHGLGESCLGSNEHGDRVPEWVEKWAALICEYLDLEEAILRRELLRKDIFKQYTEATAAAEAKGVMANRLQNVVITLDKVRMFLGQPDQPQGPCLTMLSSKEVAEHLWNGHRSIAKRLLRCIAQIMASQTISRRINAAKDNSDLKAALTAAKGQLPPVLQKVFEAVMVRAKGGEDAKEMMASLIPILREGDMQNKGGLTAAADIITLYARTQRWVTVEKGYKGVQSPPVPINLQDLFLNREATQLLLPPEKSSEGKKRLLGPVARAEEEQRIQAAAEKAAALLARQHSKNPALRKLYRPTYCWGQLSGWFKQTVNDPTASLSAERRGTLSLPDIESCFIFPKTGYAKQRSDLLQHLEQRPEAMWRTGTQWSFKNESKVYGSPMFDKSWVETMLGDCSGDNPLPEIVAELKAAEVPFVQSVAKGTRRKGGKKKEEWSDDDDDDDDDD